MFSRRFPIVASLFLAGLLAGHSLATDAVTLLRTPNRGIQPQVVVDGKGIVHLIYFRGAAEHGDIFYVRSDNAGAKFSDPIQVNSERGSAIAIGNIRGADLAVGKNGRVHVAWNGSGRKGQPNEGMLYARLNDKGTAFEPQRNLMQVTGVLDGGGSVAADDAGNVYVAWHAPELGKTGEGNRRVWVARSTDDGKTFAREKAAFEKETGACGCCGLRLRRSQGHGLCAVSLGHGCENRDTYLLISKDKGTAFEGDKIDPWKVKICPMSSYAFAEGDGHVLAAWETKEQVYFSAIDTATGKRSAAVAAPGDSHGNKHPAVAVDKRGQTILVWTEGMGWERGGAVSLGNSSTRTANPSASGGGPMACRPGAWLRSSRNRLADSPSCIERIAYGYTNCNGRPVFHSS